MVPRSHLAWTLALVVALIAIGVMLTTAVIDGLASTTPSVTFSINSGN